MKQMNKERNTTDRRDQRSTGNGRSTGSGTRERGQRATRSLNQTPLNTGLIHIAPWLAIFLGGAGVLAGFASNGYQVWTTQNAFLIMLLTSPFYLSALKKDPAHAAGLIPTFNSSSWVLAIFIQLGVLFFTLRVAHEFKEQMSQAEGGSAGKRIKQAGKETAVQVAHNRDFLFYYGIACFLANCLGDYGFVFSFTDNIEFLAFWGIVLTATSTMILALGAEFLWAGYNAWRHAKAEWDATYAAAYASRKGRSRPSGEGQ